MNKNKSSKYSEGESISQGIANLLNNRNLILNEIKLNKIKNINNKEKIILHDNDTITIQGDKNKISLVKNGLEYEKFDNGSWGVKKLPINKDFVGVDGIIGNSSSSSKLKIARKIGGTLFDGTTDINVDAVNSNYASQLKTARKIGGVSFNGTADINLPGVNIKGNQSRIRKG